MATKKKAKPSKITDPKVRSNVRKRARQVVKESADYASGYNAGHAKASSAGHANTSVSIGHILTVLSRLPKNDQLRIAAGYRFQMEWNEANKKIDRFAKRLGIVTTQAQALFDHYEVR